MPAKLALSSLLVALLLVVSPAAEAGTPPAGFSDVAVATGLSQPTAIAFLPDGRMLITEKGGALKLASGTGSTTTLVTVPVCATSEMGLLGVAIDPNFKANGFIYLYRSAPDSTGDCSDAVGRFNQVVRVTMTGSTVSIGSLAVLLTGIRTDNGNHDGGTLRIGPVDKKLYVSVGDSGIGDGGGPGQSTNPYAQNLAEINGKILRLELSGAPAAGNPFIGTAGARPEIFAYGFRNPFRMGFDKQTGRLWAGDVGQGSFEELDIVTAGGNYSWPRCEGTEPPGCMTEPDDVAPIFTYPLSGTGSLGRTIIGGDFAPAGFGGFDGDYFFGDNSSSNIYRADVNATRDDIAQPVPFITAAAGPTDVIFTPGALYYVSINTGQVRQVTQTAPYARPGSGTPLHVPMAPGYVACTSPNTTHVAPLALDACSPPVQQSKTLTTSSIGRGAAFVELRALPGNPATPANEGDLEITASATDVLCVAANAACPGGAGSEFTGNVALQLRTRVTDKRSSVFEGVPATTKTMVIDIPMACASTPNPNLGGACSLSTTANAAVPGFAHEEQRSIFDLDKINVLDPGPDGSFGTACPPTCDSGDENVYLRQALFTP